MVGADAELVDRADHAVRDVPVRLPRGEQEAARKRGAGQRHDDEVADDEVVGAADDAAGAPSSAARWRRRCARPSTRHQRMTLPFFCGSSTMLSTRPTVRGPVISVAGSTPSTSRPARIKASLMSRPVTRPAAGRTPVPRKPAPSSCSSHERPAELYVALHHVPHVGRVVAEHQAPLDAHAEREAAVLVRVDPTPSARAGSPRAAALRSSLARARTARVARVVQLAPWQTKHSRSSSALGSVNGK